MNETPDGFRIERGLLWPAGDVDAAPALFETIRDLEIVYPYCKGFDIAVQAGGNCGLWPRAMAAKFKTIFTFEPDPTNFRCLCANASQENVIKFNAALGDEHEMIGLHRRERNIGAHFVQGAGPIPTLLIDDLALPACDLIYLDVEGRESHALRGAIQTICRARPVIVIEDKGMSKKYGIAQGHAERWLIDVHNYRVAARPHRDIILVPQC